MPPMRVGGTRRVRLPSALAYGAQGAGCRGTDDARTCIVPPDAELDFVITLVRVKGA